MTATRRMPRPTRTALAAGAAVVLVSLTGCSSTSDDAAGGAGSDSAAAPAAKEVRGANGGGVAEVAGAAADTSEVSDDSGSAGGQVEAQKVISTGNVQLRSDDVGQAVFDVRKVVDVHGGTVSEDDTATDKDGQPLRSRMVLRIPTADFDAAMAELEDVATLASSKRESADVTTQVLDTDVRVEAQKRSIARIQVLFDNATSIRDVVSIEGELSRRQADLASLEAQQRYLADQTTMSTITLTVERTREKAAPAQGEDDAAGFLSGLEGGWGALKAFLVGAATVAGALLPWLLLALLLAVPGWPLLRRLRRHVPADSPAAT